MKYVRYFFKVLVHKWWFFVAGMKHGLPLNVCLRHDLSKFSKQEFKQYANYFATEEPTKEQKAIFLVAVAHHYANNSHHWEYWMNHSGVAQPMPYATCLEMVVDWMAAGKSYSGNWPKSNDWQWLKDNWGRMDLHHQTRYNLRVVMDKVAVDEPITLWLMDWHQK